MSDYRQGGFGGNRGGDFKKRDFGGNQRGGFGGGRPDFKRNNGGQKEMFGAICVECNKKCEVPFRPSGNKPVYCNDCFGGKREGGHNDFQKKEFTPRENAKPVVSIDYKSQFDAINIKLDKLISMMGNTNSVALKKVEEKKEEVKLIPKKIAPKKEIKKVATPKKVIKKVTGKKK